MTHHYLAIRAELHDDRYEIILRNDRTMAEMTVSVPKIGFVSESDELTSEAAMKVGETIARSLRVEHSATMRD